MNHKKLIKVTPPRYDNVFFEGVRWMDWITRTEDMGICVYFQRKDMGIDCAARNCPCDLYEAEAPSNEEQKKRPTKN